jgi:NADH:ubiquinone oxidoreductase subunit
MNLKKAKVAKKSTKRREWTKTDLKELKAHSKARTPVSKISKATKRTVGALRAKAFQLGIGLGHQR